MVLESGIPADGNKLLESTVQPNQKPTIAQDQSRKAMKFTLDTQKNTMQGASRPDIGWIAFLWGNAGTAPLFADGDGLARIIAKQDFEKKYLPSERSGHELCMRLVDIVTRGYIKRKYGPSSRPKVDLSWQGEIATVSWDPDRKTWYLAAWREDWGGILESAVKDFKSFDEFEKKYRWTFLEGEKYPPSQAGFYIYADELADLSDAYPEWAEQAEQKWEDEGYAKISLKENKQPWKMNTEEIVKSSLRLSYAEFGDQAVARNNHNRLSRGLPVMTEKDELNQRVQATLACRERFTTPIRAAKTFQDIADVFSDVFGVTVGDDPVMETAILEDDGGDWKNKLRAATTFDDIYLAFKASGIMVDYMPDTPQDAASLFNRADQFEPLVVDYISAETAVAKLETSELISKAIFADRTFSPGLLAKVIPRYETIKPKSELLPEAGKEIFENAKTKGEELVTAWHSDPDFIPTAQQGSDKRAALKLLEKERYEVDIKYVTDKGALKCSSDYFKDYLKAAEDREREMAIAEEAVKSAEIALKHALKTPGTHEWRDQLREVYSSAIRDRDGIEYKFGKIVKTAHKKMTTSDEYLNLKSEYEAKEKSFTDKKRQLNAEISDVLARIYNPLLQKILESSPVTEKQANQWVSDQVIDKSVINSLGIATLVSDDSGTVTVEHGYSGANIRKDMAELYRLSGGRFGKCHVLPREQGQNRAYADLSQRSIHVGNELTKKMLWHEMGHLIENDLKYSSVSTAFLNGRVDKTKGLIKLSVLTGDKGYNDNEEAYTDHLFDAYVGKYYGGRSTEVLSMGIQQFSSPELMHELGLKDPEMFKMILGILATPPSGSEKELLTEELNQAKSEVIKAA